MQMRRRAHPARGALLKVLILRERPPDRPDFILNVDAEELFGLTRRELDIVASVVGGSSNRQIGYRCGITEKTVKRHLTNIYDKVGLSSRLELAMFALKHQLVGEAANATSRR